MISCIHTKRGLSPVQSRCNHVACALTEVNAILGTAPPLRDPPFASKVLIGGKGADEVRPQGAEVPPQLQDGQGLLANDTDALLISSAHPPPRPQHEDESQARG